jgi:hypothetical protein
MLRHTFRGSTLKSCLGLETARDVFTRFKALRRAEREYLADVLGPIDGTTHRVPPAPARIAS